MIVWKTIFQMTLIVLLLAAPVMSSRTDQPPFEDRIVGEGDQPSPQRSPAQGTQRSLADRTASSLNSSLDDLGATDSPLSYRTLTQWINEGDIASIIAALDQRQLMLPQVGEARALIIGNAASNPSAQLDNYFAGFVAAWNISPEDILATPARSFVNAENILARLCPAATLHQHVTATPHQHIALLEILFGRLGAQDVELNQPATRRNMPASILSWLDSFRGSSGPLIQSWASYVIDQPDLAPDDPLFVAQGHFRAALNLQADLNFLDIGTHALTRNYHAYWRLRVAAMRGYQPAIALYWRIVQTPYLPLRRARSFVRPSPPAVPLNTLNNSPIGLTLSNSSQSLILPHPPQENGNIEEEGDSRYSRVSSGASSPYGL